MGFFDSKSSTTNRTETANANAQDNAGTTLAGVTRSNVTVTDAGAVAGVIDLTNKIIEQNAGITRSNFEQALGFAQSATKPAENHTIETTVIAVAVVGGLVALVLLRGKK